MAGHPLRSATDRRLGGPLPHQLANQTRAHPIPPEFFTLYHAIPCAYAVLSVVSNCYPPVWGRLPTRYSPVRHSLKTRHPEGIVKIKLVRLACVKHAASVHPEPGSNSHVASKQTSLSSYRASTIRLTLRCFSSSEKICDFFRYRSFLLQNKLGLSEKLPFKGYIKGIDVLILTLFDVVSLFSYQGTVCCVSNSDIITP